MSFGCKKASFGAHQFVDRTSAALMRIAKQRSEHQPKEIHQHHASKAPNKVQERTTREEIKAHTQVFTRQTKPWEDRNQSVLSSPDGVGCFEFRLGTQNARFLTCRRATSHRLRSKAYFARPEPKNKNCGDNASAIASYCNDMTRTPCCTSGC